MATWALEQKENSTLPSQVKLLLSYKVKTKAFELGNKLRWDFYTQIKLLS